MNNKDQIGKCHICKNPVSLKSGKNPCVPFCSERCPTINLGAWLESKSVIESDAPFFKSEQ